MEALSCHSVLSPASVGLHRPVYTHGGGGAARLSGRFCGCSLAFNSQLQRNCVALLQLWPPGVASWLAGTQER